MINVCAVGNPGDDCSGLKPEEAGGEAAAEAPAAAEAAPAPVEAAPQPLPPLLLQAMRPM